MAIGTSNQTTIAYAEESVPGTANASSNSRLLRFTGESLNANNTTTISDEIRSDRATSDLAITDQSNSGEINGELSGGTYDYLMAAALFSEFFLNGTRSDLDKLAATADGFTNSISTFSFQVGQYVRVSGFSTAGLNRFYRVTAATTAAITTDPAPSETEAAGEDVTIEGSTITSGKRDNYFTFEKSYLDVDPIVRQYFYGTRVSSMSMSLTVGSLATMTFGLLSMSNGIVTGDSSFTGAQIPATTTAIMNAVGDVTNITATSANITSAISFTELSLSYDNALRELKALGTLGSTDIRPGTIVATATINPYFENKELLEAFKNNETFALSWQISSSDGYDYIFSLPSVKFTSQTLAAGAKDTDMIINAETQAILDVATNTTMRIDRFSP